MVLVTNWSCTLSLLMYSMNFHAASGCCERAPIDSAIEPLTPGLAPDGPLGEAKTCTWSTTWEIEGSLRSRSVDSQLRDIAALPAALKAWIDQIVRMGRTVRKTEAGFEGLARGKRVVVLATSGSDFRPGTPGGAYNFLEPYLRAVLGFIGITDIEVVYAHSLNQGEAGAVQALAAARQQLHQLAAA